jgi:hypothetical protein
MEGLHKLSSPWEGPFSISKVTAPGSYCLQTLEDNDISCVASTRRRLATLRAQVYTTTPGLHAVSSLTVLALVFELLVSKIQRQLLLTDLGLLRALRTLAAVYKTMYSRSSLYGY